MAKRPSDKSDMVRLGFKRDVSALAPWSRDEPAHGCATREDFDRMADRGVYVPALVIRRPNDAHWQFGVGEDRGADVRPEPGCGERKGAETRISGDVWNREG